jgi:beta-glucanase (GH16 family)
MTLSPVNGQPTVRSLLSGDRARRGRLASFWALGLLVVVASAPLVTGSAQASSGGQVADGLRLVWADEFERDSPDPETWRLYHNTYGDGGRELQCYTPDNVDVADGTMRIEARREAVRCPVGTNLDRDFTSGFLGTRERGVYFPRFGRFEIRAKLPHAQGMFPAFWLRHRDGSSTAEVDIMEYFHSQDPGRTTATLHLDGRYNLSKRVVAVESPDTSPAWHTWAVDIEPVDDGVQFTFLFDGQPYHTYVDSQAEWAKRHPGEHLWDIAVNLAVGGNWTGHPDAPLGYLDLLDRCSKWGVDAGTPPDNCNTDGINRAVFPEVFEVDYVRVYEHVSADDEPTAPAPPQPPDVSDGQPLPPGVLVPSGSKWRWRYLTGSWPTGWLDPSYDDGHWKLGPGPLGFGASQATDIDGFASTADRPLSAQFRRTFEVDDPAAVSDLILTATANDGVVVFVNGTEVGRANLPVGPLSAGTWATAAPRASVADLNPVSFKVPVDLLRAGTNVVAASTHLNYRATADASFDLTLSARVQTKGASDPAPTPTEPTPTEPTPTEPTPTEPTPTEPTPTEPTPTEPTPTEPTPTEPTPTEPTPTEPTPTEPTPTEPTPDKDRSKGRNPRVSLRAAELAVSGCVGTSYAFAGDWDRSGRDGLGWWCDGQVRLRTADGEVISYRYGRAGDVPIVADWNGDGRDTVSIVRDRTWHINDDMDGGDADRSFVYGRVTQGDVPIAGDWNGDGRDTIGIIRDGEWHLRLDQAGGPGQVVFTYGRITRGDRELIGDWNGDGADTIGIVRDGEWHLRHSLSGGPGETVYVYGRVTTGDTPVMGDWTGDRRTTPGIVRRDEWHLRHRHAAGHADQTVRFAAS